MGKKAASAKKKEPTASASVHKSDAEIMKDREQQSKFVFAQHLHTLHMFMIAAIGSHEFQAEYKSDNTFADLAIMPSIIGFVIFTYSLPTDWPLWRSAWVLLIAVYFALELIYRRELGLFIQSFVAIGVTLTLAFLPRGKTQSQPLAPMSSTLVVARVLVIKQVLYIAYQCGMNYTTEGLAVPLALITFLIAVFLGSTQEMFAVVEASSFLNVAILLKCWGRQVDQQDFPHVMTPLLGLLAAQTLLFLPILDSDPKRNPYYGFVSKIGTELSKLLSNPIGGYGDD